LIVRADDISVIVQSLIKSGAGSCSASQVCTRGVSASFNSAATISDVSR
jgi:hypothetical protein